MATAKSVKRCLIEYITFGFVTFVQTQQTLQATTRFSYNSATLYAFDFLLLVNLHDHIIGFDRQSNTLNL